MPIRIRRASPADEAAIDQWQRSMQDLSEYLAIGPNAVPDPAAVMKRMAEWLKQPRERKIPQGWERIDLVAVEDTGAICGYAALMFGPAHPVTGQPEAYLAELHVWPDYRKRGVARGLLELAEAYAVQKGVPHLSITVAAGNEALFRLFQNAGYRAETIKLTKRVGRSQE